jgi:hypothetical protein
MNYELEILCKNGSWEQIVNKVGKDTHLWNECLFFACIYGRTEIADLAIVRGANDFNNGLYYACRYGFMELVDMMIEFGANNWNLGYKGACNGGYREIVRFMVEKGVTNYHEGFMYACFYGYKDIVQYIMSIYRYAKESLWLHHGVCLYRWVDMIKYVYGKSLKDYRDMYDMKHVLCNVTIDNIEQIKVKLFDRNLFVVN